MIKYLLKTINLAKLNDCYYIADLDEISKFPDKEIIQRILEP